MKIQIIGGSGTGKSTLAQYMSKQENIKWIDTDQYLWKDDTFTENNPIERRMEMYQEDMKRHDSYVVSGSVYSWYPEGFTERDLLVFLSVDEELRMERLRKREFERSLSNKIWLDEQQMYTNDFLEWCKTYWTEDDACAAGTYAEQSYQMSISESPVLRLDGSKSLNALHTEIISTYLFDSRNQFA